MSQRLISRSPDLKRLRDEGFEVAIKSGHLVISHVPYVNSQRQVRYGTLVSVLTLNGDVTVQPADHVVSFAGEAPCSKSGDVLQQIVNGEANQPICDGLTVNFTFSSKPPQGYPDYYEKMTTYVKILQGHARFLDPNATACTFPLIIDDDEDSVFKYMDTASSRAGISAITDKLKFSKVAIIGLGGTGSYILDLVAKTPVNEIHLYDADRFLQHNAFRSPGAASTDDLEATQTKVGYLEKQYAKMRHGIHAHETNLDEGNLTDLEGMDFAFLSLTNGAAKQLIVAQLEELGTSFIDVGMGVDEADQMLGGQVRITTSTPVQRQHVHTRHRIPFTDGEADDYGHNIQIAELGALNAALAVIRWKKLAGFYRDLEHEHFAVYSLDGNHLLNEDQS